MKSAISRTEYLSLIEEIRRHDRLYYVEHAPHISDEEYDFLMKRLEAIEKAHPDWVEPNSPTKRVSESLTEGFKSVAHKVPMVSLANTYTQDELEEFLKRVHKGLGKTGVHFTCELKMDGLAVSALYEKGVFKRGATRGSGRLGDDVKA